MRRYFLVNDHGEIFRMTVTRYGQYLRAGALEDKIPNAEDFGTFVGSAITVNKFTPAEFSEAYKTFGGRRNWSGKR